MSNKHVNEIPADETATVAGITAKKVFVFDNDGNQITSFGGPGAGNATITLRGNVTVAMPGGATVFQGTDPWNTTLVGNVTISDSKKYIGLVSVSHAAWADPNTYIGLATVDIGASNGVAVKGNVTLSDSQGYIGLVSIGGGIINLRGNVTLSDSKTFIGLTTTVEGTPYAPATLVHGMVSSASGGIVQFPSNTIKYVTVKASFGNPTTAYIGGSSATINNGYHIDPGDSVGLALDNTNRLYLVGVGTTEVRFIGGN